MVGILPYFWDDLFSRAKLLVLGRVKSLIFYLLHHLVSNCGTGVASELSTEAHLVPEVVPCLRTKPFSTWFIAPKNATPSCRVWDYPYHLWYIYLHECLLSMVNVGKYTSPMNAMGSTPWSFGILRYISSKGKYICNTIVSHRKKVKLHNMDIILRTSHFWVSFCISARCFKVAKDDPSADPISQLPNATCKAVPPGRALDSSDESVIPTCG